MASGRVLIAGATGFVGARLYPALKARGYDVVGASRYPEWARSRYPGRDFVHLDVQDEESVRHALKGCRAAVYLVHAMAGGRGYERIERKEARIFREAAADAKLERLVYLGGMAPCGRPSHHLRSRLDTGRLLRAGSVPTIELQATMVLGSGGASFRMVRDLAARLPLILLPSWAESVTEPVSVDDVVFALSHALEHAPAESRAYPLPGPQRLNARAILLQTAALLGRSPRVVRVPLLSPKLSSYAIRLVTRADHRITDELIEGLRHDIVAPDPGYWKLCPEHRRETFTAAVRKALSEEAETLSAGEQLLETGIYRVTPKHRSGSIA